MDGLLKIINYLIFSELLDFFLEHFFLVYLFEFTAALSGSVYLTRIGTVSRMTRLLVYFLWVTFFQDLFGFYAIYAWFTDYQTLPFIKDTPFQRNLWLVNIYNLLFYTVFFSFFREQINSLKMKKRLKFLMFLFIVTAALNLFFSGIFFKAFSAYTAITGTIFLMVHIGVFYYEMLTSDKILHFYKNLSFYVSVGVLFWSLVVTPLFIYNSYFSTSSPDFVALHSFIIKITNVFMYGLFAIGFFLCSQLKFKPDRPISRFF